MKVEFKYRGFAYSNDAIFKTNLASLKCDSSSILHSDKVNYIYLVYQKTITDVNAAISHFAFKTSLAIFKFMKAELYETLKGC